MGNIVHRPEGTPNSTQQDGSAYLPSSLREKMTSSMNQLVDEKTRHLFADLLRGAEVARNLVASIQKDVVYIARIPKHLEEGVKTGALTFMRKADTGESLGAIVGTDNLNRGFVRIEEGHLSNPDILHSLSNLAMQQQLSQMAEVLDDVRNKVVILQETYDKSLVGSIRGMHKQLIQMRDTKDEGVRKQLATGAITILNDTRGKITERLLFELNQLPRTPASLLKAAAKTFFVKGFNSQVTDGYDKIQELFCSYLAATQIMAYVYFYLGEPLAYDDVFAPDNDLINNKNIEKLILAERCVGCLEEAWYKQPELFLGRIQKESEKLFLNTNDAIEIELSGQQLLEVLINGEEE